MTAEEIRRVSGGVIGHFTPKELGIDFAVDTVKGITGDNQIGLKVPANKFVYGAYLKNLTDDLEGAGASVEVKLDQTSLLASTTVADLKGKGKAKLIDEPEYVTEETEIILTVSGGNVTAGNLLVGVIYG